MDNYSFKESFREAVQKADAISFDVTHFDPAHPKPGVTNYEFDYIRNDPSLLKKTTFKIDGQEVKWNGEKFVKP
ncbi:MAG: hypothetical protein J0H74_36320 [Chitinophagaceae bacterium]|nr:hypothetical protein [Chitinophagaceae bacterium]